MTCHTSPKKRDDLSLANFTPLLFQVGPRSERQARANAHLTFIHAHAHDLRWRTGMMDRWECAAFAAWWKKRVGSDL